MKQTNPWERAEVDPTRLKDNRFVHPERKPIPPEGDLEEKVEEKNDEGSVPDPVQAKKKGVSPAKPRSFAYKQVAEGRRWRLMESDEPTYALSVHALRDSMGDPMGQGKLLCRHPTSRKDSDRRFTDDHMRLPSTFPNPDPWFMRPLTVEENIDAMVNDFETLEDSDGNKRSVEDRLKLFRYPLDSCSGIAFKRDSTKFKIVQRPRELVFIDVNFKDAFFELSDQAYDDLNYSLFECYEFDSDKCKLDVPLTKKEILNNSAWWALKGGNFKSKYDDMFKAYVDILLSVKKKDLRKLLSPKIMAFSTLHGKPTHQNRLYEMKLCNLSHDYPHNTFGDARSKVLNGEIQDFPFRFPYYFVELK